MKVLIIPSFYPDFLNKNVGVFFKEQVDYLNDFGLDLDVIYVEQKSLRKLNFSNIFNNHYQFKTILRKASKDYRLLGWKMPGYLGSKLWILLMEILFKRYIKINGIPDLIHAHNIFNGGIVAFNLSKKYNIPYIITEHDSAFLNTDFSIKQKNIIQNIYSNSSKIISVSNSLKAQINKIVQNIEIEVIPNVVNNLFQVSYKEISEIKKNIEFISIGNLNKNKGHDFLIDAFKLVSKKHQNIFLRICGDGPEKMKLLKKISTLKLENKVKLLGHLDKKDVLKNLLRSDCLVHTSHVETFGIVLVEALSLGIPIITTNSGGPKDIFEPEMGYMVDKVNSELISNAMIDFIINKESFNRSKIKSLVKKYSPSVICNKITSVYIKSLKI